MCGSCSLKWPLEAIPGHDLGWSKACPGSLVFTASPEHKAAERRTVIKVSTYVRRFYPHLTEADADALIQLIRQQA